MAGCDLNPQNGSVTVALPNGNFKVSKVILCPDPPYVSAEHPYTGRTLDVGEGAIMLGKMSLPGTGKLSPSTGLSRIMD